jgi:hypothetical protein
MQREAHVAPTRMLGRSLLVASAVLPLLVAGCTILQATSVVRAGPASLNRKPARVLFRPVDLTGLTIDGKTEPQLLAVRTPKQIESWEVEKAAFHPRVIDGAHFLGTLKRYKARLAGIAFSFTEEPPAADAVAVTLRARAMQGQFMDFDATIVDAAGATEELHFHVATMGILQPDSWSLANQLRNGAHASGIEVARWVADNR